MKKLSDEEIIHQGNLEITTKIGCTNMCEYCPQIKLINRYKEGCATCLTCGYAKCG